MRCMCGGPLRGCIPTKSPVALQPGFSLLVRMKGLEPSRDKALVPKTSVSTNFTTPASLLEKIKHFIR